MSGLGEVLSEGLLMWGITWISDVEPPLHSGINPIWWWCIILSYVLGFSFLVFR